MINSILPLYDIFFYSHDGTRVLLLDSYQYLEFAQKLNDSWFGQIRMEFAPEDDRLTFFRETLTRDFLVEIYRVDPQLNTRNLVFEGFHRTLVDQIKQDGVVVITLYLTGYTNLSKRRIVIPDAGQENSVKSGVAETAMKAFVNEQAISPVDSNRIITGLTNEVDSGAGANAEYSARYTNLFTVVERLAQQGEVDFGIVKGATIGTFLFRVKELWGTDRRIGNADGNAPTLFDVTLNNMSIPIFTLNGNDEINYVYVGGQGQGAARTIQEDSDAAAILVSPWNRYEDFVDARNEANPDGLTTRGQAQLDDHTVRSDLNFNLEETDGTRWLRDWALGDLVSARYGNTMFEKKIIKVSVVVSAGKTGKATIEVINAELENI